jgi:hypothetical protein
LSKIGSDWQAFEIGIGIEIGCSTAMIDSGPDFDKRTIRETERISDNPYIHQNVFSAIAMKPYQHQGFRSPGKTRDLRQGQGGSEFSAAPVAPGSATGIRLVFEDWKRGPDAEMGRKDNFEMAS